MVTVLSGKWARYEKKPRRPRKPDVADEKEKRKRRRALTPDPPSVSVNACSGGLPSLGKKR
jgi:hypothetical protein